MRGGDLMSNDRNLILLTLVMRSVRISARFFSCSRVSAAVNFKNFVKRNWRVVDDADKIPADDRLRIKTMIVDLMISMPGRGMASDMSYGTLIHNVLK